VLHHWAKYLVVMLGALAIAGFLLSFCIEALRPHRRVWLFVALSLSLAPLTVTALKAASVKHCPWSLAQFGGYLPYIRLFETPPPGLEPGHCFPAGHASTGFALMSFYFVGRARGRAKAAWGGLAAGLIAGLALGSARMMQGAHFLSHTLWSGLVCWTVILLLSVLVLRLRAYT
jgi:membrane-associated PAP2 superfamily phosphatase